MKNIQWIKNRFILAKSPRKRLLPPRIPIHRVGRVLQQIRAFFTDQTILAGMLAQGITNVVSLRPTSLQTVSTRGTSPVTASRATPALSTDALVCGSLPWRLQTIKRVGDDPRSRLDIHRRGFDPLARHNGGCRQIREPLIDPGKIAFSSLK